MAQWERKKILIWGKTRPELSKNHKETVCTGGVFEDTKKFVRLYPIPLRFLDDETYFKKYQWIVADVRKALRDARPESYNIRPDSIELGDTIPTESGDWSRRAEWIIQPDHIFESVTALQEAREKTGTTIGMVKPHEVLDFMLNHIQKTRSGSFGASTKQSCRSKNSPSSRRMKRRSSQSARQTSASRSGSKVVKMSMSSAFSIGRSMHCIFVARKTATLRNRRVPR